MLEVENNFFLSLRKNILLMHLKFSTTFHFEFTVFYLSTIFYFNIITFLWELFKKGDGELGILPKNVHIMHKICI